MTPFRGHAGNIRVFRPSSHAARMAHSYEFISIPTIPNEHFVRCILLPVSMNAEFVPPHDSHAALFIQPIALGSSGQLNLTLPEEFTFCVYVQPVTALLGHTSVDALILEDFDRATPKGTGSAKVVGNYSPVLRWTLTAKTEGFRNHSTSGHKTRSEVEEFSVATFIGVKRSGDEITLVTPDSQSVSKGVKSDSCFVPGKKLGGMSRLDK
jgi:branched-chain amino acid aminotransferase